MEILDKTNSETLAEYEAFAEKSPFGSFMQSLRWCDVKSNWGSEAVVSRSESGELQGVCLVLIKKIPILGRSLMYSPHGPCCDPARKDIITDLLCGIKLLAKKHKACSFLCDPPFEEKDTAYSELLTEMGFRHIENAPELTTVQPRNNYMLRNIGGKTPEEVMMGFHPDWRNRIRKASRKGVFCKACGAEALDDFYPLMQETGRRDGFAIRAKEYFVRFINSLGSEHCRLFMCYVNEDGKDIPLSGAVAVRYAGKTSYVYGASASHHRNLYPNYLMQWTMINWALEGGCYIYDFMGIPFYNDPGHPNYGVYRFKKGFCGEVVTFAGEYRYVFRPVSEKLLGLCRSLLHSKRERQRLKLLKASDKTERPKRSPARLLAIVVAAAAVAGALCFASAGLDNDNDNEALPASAKESTTVSALVTTAASTEKPCTVSVEKDASENSFIIENVPHICQKDLWPTGCESVAAVGLMNFYDHNISVDEFIDSYLPMTGLPQRVGGELRGESPWSFFIGDPRSKSGFGCYSTVIASALRDAGLDVMAISGESMGGLAERYVAKGDPVIVWATVDMQPSFEGRSWRLANGEMFTFTRPEHALLLIGYDEDNFYFSDSLKNASVTAYPRDACERAFAALGKQALVHIG